MDVTLKNISHRYSGVRALDDVSLTIASGEFLAVLGQNGAGKSTLAGVIGGLVHPTGGEYQLDGETVNASRVGIVSQGVVVIPEGRRLFGDLSVADNIRLGAYALRLRRKALGSRLDDVVQFLPVGLRQRLDIKAGALSGGERQMVAVARAIMAKPRVLIADEPSLGLAPLAVAPVYELFQNLHADGVTMVVIEQESSAAIEACTRSIVLRRGNLVFASKPGETLSAERLHGLYFGERHGGASETTAG